MPDQLSPGHVDRLLAGWTAGSGPLYRRLAAALRAAMEEGRLAGGAVLPPERVLAEELNVSRSTVVAALEQLKGEGLLAAQQGSGTWVRRRRYASDGRRELVQDLEDHAILRDLQGPPPGVVSLTAATVDCAPEVRRAHLALDEPTLLRWTQGHGYLPLGVQPMREAVAERLSDRGLATRPDQVLITTGATEAVLLAARLFAEPGDPVAVETPSYAGALDVLVAAGARLLPVPMDHLGVRTDLLADVLARSLPRLVYLVPDFHNPTGLVLGDARRREVARLAAEYQVPVIEDLVLSDLWLDAPPPPPIATHNPNAPILTVGSMSKVFWGGLRVGWIRSNEATIARLGRIKAVTNFGTPVLDQLVSARLVPETDEVAARRRAELSEQLAVVTGMLTQHLPDWSWTRPAGGLCLWAQLPTPQANELTRAAFQRGLEIVPGPTFAVGDRRHRDRVRLPLSAPTDVLAEGIPRLAAAWADVVQRTAPAHRQTLVV